MITKCYIKTPIKNNHGSECVNPVVVKPPPADSPEDLQRERRAGNGS
jgi:hypothetical protein